MGFANPRALWALSLLPLMGLFLWSAERRRRRALARLGEWEMVRHLMEVVNWRGRRWRRLLWLLALLMLILALARPQWGSRVEVVEQQGIQVMVALDVSRSMLAQDLKPDRLTRAKLEIADLMTRLDGDEIGLVLFSGASFIQFPLTSDYSTARLFLDSASPAAISRQGTAIAEAIRTAMSGFDAHRNAQKVILLVTDGESHEGDALGAAQEAAREGVRIYTLGIGSPQGEPIPEYDASGTLVGYKKDRSGQVVISKLDESTLQDIARLGGGRYLRVRPDGGELDELMAELDKLQAAQLETRFQTQKMERFQPFLLLALLALVIAELIPPRANEKTRFSEQ